MLPWRRAETEGGLEVFVLVHDPGRFGDVLVRRYATGTRTGTGKEYH